MRSQTDSGDEAAGNEQVIPGGKFEIHKIEGALSYEELDKLDKEFFGESKEPKEDSPLEWKTMKSDNYLIRNLKHMAGLFAYSIQKNAEAAQKDIKKARKVFYGR